MKKARPWSGARRCGGLKRFAFDLVHQIKSKAQHSCWFQSLFAANVMRIGCKPPSNCVQSRHLVDRV
jgi:hypothetical protein